MGEITEAQKRAHKTYIEKFARMEIRVTHEQRNIVKAHADAHGESVNEFINRAIREAMERDSGAPETGVLSLPPDTLKAAQEGAEAAGEAVPQFIARAISETMERQKGASK